MSKTTHLTTTEAAASCGVHKGTFLRRAGRLGISPAYVAGQAFRWKRSDVRAVARAAK